MSLTKEVAHDLRMVTTQPADLAVLPPWARIVPLGFYAGFAVFLLGFAYNTFQQRLFIEKQKSLAHVIEQYEGILAQDRQTTSKLVEQGNSAVRVARWVDYSPMLQRVLMGIFTSFDPKVQVGQLQVERKPGIQPEYTLNLSFRAEVGEISGVIKKMRDSLPALGWQLVIGTQNIQDSITNFQGYIQPIPSAMPLESQFLPVLQDPNKRAAAPTGVSQ